MTNSSRPHPFTFRGLGYTEFVLLWLLASPLIGAEWPDEYQAGRFLCHANFPLAMNRGLLDSMTQLEADIVRRLKITPRPEPIHLFLFYEKATYQEYLKRYFPDVPPRKALFIKGRGPGMVFAHRSEGFETDVRHECTHALLNASLPTVPLWLDEGLAEYFEAAPDRREFGSPHLNAVQWNARQGRVPNLAKLEQLRELKDMTSSDYQDAWAWVHFMLHGPDAARGELIRYLADIRNCTPCGSLRRRLQSRIPDLDRQFISHFTSWR